MLAALLTFALSGAVIVVAGSVLARAGDAIAERTGLGRLWVGSVLLAGATSLPEAATDVAAVRIGAPDLAVGDLFGSSLANMLILAVLDLLHPRRRILDRVPAAHALGATLAIALNALAALFVLAPFALSLGPLGAGSSVLFGVYLAGTWVGYRRARTAALPVPDVILGPSLPRASAAFAVAAAAIFVAAPRFAVAARDIAAATGLGATFMGTWAVGISTSLPELASCLAAIQLGAPDLAVANLFGSNAFNMALFIVLDLAHPGGSIFTAIDRAHAVSGLLAVVITSAAFAALAYRGAPRLFAPGSRLIVLIYALAILLVYLQGAP